MGFLVSVLYIRPSRKKLHHNILHNPHPHQYGPLGTEPLFEFPANPNNPSANSGLSTVLSSSCCSTYLRLSPCLQFAECKGARVLGFQFQVLVLARLHHRSHRIVYEPSCEYVLCCRLLVPTAASQSFLS